MKRKILLVAVMATALFALAACGVNVEDAGDVGIAFTETSIEVDARNFSSTFEEVFVLTRDDAVSVDASLNSGSLEIIVTNISTGDVAFSGNNIWGNSLSFAVREDGEHTIRIVGDEFYGRLRLEW